MLAQSANGAFLFADCELQFFVEAVHAAQVVGSKQFKQKRRYLCKLAEDGFYVGTDAFEFLAFCHVKSVAKNEVLVRTPKRARSC
jgi:hypothetical protein